MRKEKLIISARAKKDLFDIWDYIAADNPGIADKFLNLLYEKCELLKETPEAGRKRDELLPGVRSLPVRKYIIFCRIKDNAVEIIRILSGYRDIDSLF
jgi:toxin ParE1/3/4